MGGMGGAVSELIDDVARYVLTDEGRRVVASLMGDKQIAEARNHTLNLTEPETELLHRAAALYTLTRAWNDPDREFGIRVMGILDGSLF